MVYFKVSDKLAELIKDTRQSQKGLRDNGLSLHSIIGVTQLIPKCLSTPEKMAHFGRDIAPALCPVSQVQTNEELPNAVVGKAWCWTWHGCSNYHQMVLLGIDFPLEFLPGLLFSWGVNSINFFMECLRAEEEFALCIAAPLESVSRCPQSLLGVERTFPQGTQGKFQLMVCLAAHRVPRGWLCFHPKPNLQPSVAFAAPRLMANANIAQ